MPLLSGLAGCSRPRGRFDLPRCRATHSGFPCGQCAECAGDAAGRGRLAICRGSGRSAWRRRRRGAGGLIRTGEGSDAGAERAAAVAVDGARLYRGHDPRGKCKFSQRCPGADCESCHCHGWRRSLSESSCFGGRVGCAYLCFFAGSCSADPICGVEDSAIGVCRPKFEAGGDGEQRF